MGLILSIILGVVPAFIYALFVYWLDRYGKEPKFLLAGVFVWGAVVASGGAFLINTTLGLGVYFLTGSEAAADISIGSIVAPLVEESLKGFAVLIVYIVFHHEFDNILDGIIYAGMVALGFAAVENAYYINVYGYEEGGLEGAIVLAFIRNFLVGWQHPFYTAFTGIGLAISRLKRSRFVKLLVPFLGWGIAVVAHALHNTFTVFISGLEGLVFGTLLDWSGWVFMIVVIIWSIYRERGFIKRYLQREVENGVITQAQYQTASSTLAMGLARMYALGSGQYLETNRFYHLCAELAHKRRQLATMGNERGNLDTIQKLRAELAHLSPRVHS